jgi:Ca2+-binding EF-hand superfamily protein
MPAGTSPHFYTHAPETLRPGTLLFGTALAAVFWAGVLLLVGRGGHASGVSIGAYRAEPSSPILFARSSDPAPLSLAAHLPDAPADPLAAWTEGYFKLILVLDALDTNHDRQLSAAEIQLAPAALAKLDLDHDGQLTAEECGAYFGHPPTAANTPDELVATLMAFDRNRDGKLDRRELPERFHGLFAQAGEAGPLTATQIRAIAARYADPETIRRARLIFMRFHPVTFALDSNRDGVLSPEEIRNAPASLLKLDTNGDRRLSSSELIPDLVSRSVARLMTLDRDADGAITPAERQNPYAEGLRELLDNADSNRDGIVTEAEVRAELQRRIHPAR